MIFFAEFCPGFAWMGPGFGSIWIWLGFSFLWRALAFHVEQPLPSRFIEVRAAGEAPFLCEEAPGQPRGDWLFPQVTLSAKLGSGPRTVQIRAGSKLQDRRLEEAADDMSGELDPRGGE